MRIKRKYTLLRKLQASRRMTASMFWSEFAVKVISYLCALIILMMILSVTLPVSAERLSEIMDYVAIVVAVLWCIPIARNTRFRLRDAGYTPKAYLWLLLPVIGWIAFIVILFAKSIPATDESIVDEF